MRTQPAHVPLISDLVLHLQTPGLTPDALTQFLTLRTFAAYSAEIIYINRLDKDGMVRTVSTYGLAPDIEKSWREFPFDLELPSNDSIRTNSIVWLADPEEWRSLYPDLAQRALDTNRPTHISIPIGLAGGASGTIGVLLTKVLPQDDASTSFMTAVAGLVSLYFTSINNIQEETGPEYLTPRQIKVLHLIYEGFTFTYMLHILHILV